MEVVYIADVQKTYAMVIGVVLVLLGLVGFFQVPILGIFGVNLAQNILHLVGGALILWLASKGSAKPTNMWVGIIALVVGVLWFIPGASGLLASIFAINAEISYLHIAVGVVSLGVAYGVKEAA
ncbi:DUF4383 domain-containing protein [Candidatus Woesearchaeota archaeon]|nr:DUF4383 domain-containing protein [Candidatus Woesearchaeota archaeon]